MFEFLLEVLMELIKNCSYITFILMLSFSDLVITHMQVYYLETRANTTKTSSENSKYLESVGIYSSIFHAES